MPDRLIAQSCALRSASLVFKKITLISSSHFIFLFDFMLPIHKSFPFFFFEIENQHFFVWVFWVGGVDTLVAGGHLRN